MAARKRKKTSADESGDNTPEKKPLQPPWKAGQSGNPRGRPKGSRNKISEAFLADLYEDWEGNGVEVIRQVREERPADYLKVVASVLPKDLNVNVNPLDMMTDEQLRNYVSSLVREARAFGLDVDGGSPANLH